MHAEKKLLRSFVLSYFQVPFPAFLQQLSACFTDIHVYTFCTDFVAGALEQWTVPPSLVKGQPVVAVYISWTICYQCELLCGCFQLCLLTRR